MKSAAGLWAIFTVAVAQGAPRTSGTYSITTDTVDLGGTRATSAAYTNDGSAGGAAGLSTAAAPVESAKSGYAGQLYDVTGLAVSASTDPATAEAGASFLLGAWQNLDDGSYLAVDPGAVTWSVVGGPITGISAAGLAMAGAVSQNTVATVQGAYGGYVSQLGVTVEVPSAAFTDATATPIISDGYTATGNTIDLSLGFAPTAGTVLTVVDNTGPNPIQGTFGNLAQGQTVSLSYGGQVYTFVANYQGGTNGRSLVLQWVSAVPALSWGASLLLALLLLAVGARRLAPKRAPMPFR